MKEMLVMYKDQVELFEKTRQKQILKHSIHELRHSRSMGKNSKCPKRFCT